MNRPPGKRALVPRVRDPGQAPSALPHVQSACNLRTGNPMLPMKNKPYKGLSLAPLPPAFDLCPVQSLVPTTHPPSQENFEEVAERLVRGTGLISSTSSR